ncbi:hypothetical protein [Alteribacillus sp. HJP-4]|uniref:hypothetical protein n=1 Tax=Alteribacillus sp. HJP-4 TaxID=2775394 RepID=UPI0035CCDD71
MAVWLVGGYRIGATVEKPSGAWKSAPCGGKAIGSGGGNTSSEARKKTVPVEKQAERGKAQVGGGNRIGAVEKYEITSNGKSSTYRNHQQRS